MLTPMKRQKKGQAAPRRAAALAMALFAFVLAAGAAGGWGRLRSAASGAAMLRAELAAWNSDRTEERSPLGVLTALAMQDSAMLQKQPRGGGGRCPGGQRSGRRQRRQPR